MKFLLLIICCLCTTYAATAQKLIPNIVVVRFVNNVTEMQVRELLPIGVTSAAQLLTTAQSSYSRTKSPKAPYQNLEMLRSAEDKLTRTWTIRYSHARSPAQLALWLMQKYPSIVEVAEPKYLDDVQGTPNDPLAPQQQAFVVTKMLQAWNISEGNRSVVIGIVDNGVEQLHEDLQGNISLNTAEIPDNGIDDDNNGYIDDYAGYNMTWAIDNTKPGDTKNNSAGGHGTQVAGIASAHTNNGKGVAGFGFACSMIPVKAGPLTGSITHGYEGILYAVSRGCRVINTSWGVVKPPSLVEQTIIDYCVANDVLIVASGGNHGNGPTGNGWKSSNYPASYIGVFGVAESNLQDAVTTGSGLGRNVQLAAPGYGALSTSAGNGYGSVGGGTSFCSPMVAGVAGLLRDRHPFLTAMQIAALLRLSGADITNKNAAIAEFVPKRLDAFAALSLDPLSTPGVRVLAVERRKNGVLVDRLRAGDTVAIRYQLKNELANVSDLAVNVRIADQGDWSAKVLQGSHEVAQLDGGATVWTSDYVVEVTQMGLLPLVLKLDMTSGIYTDVAFDNMQTSSTMAIMKNDKLVYSIGDDGKLAYDSNKSGKMGVGMNWKNEFALMSYSGIILSAGSERALKGYDNLTEESNFTVKKPFVAPERERNVMDDSNVLPSKLIGVEVSQRCTFPSQSSDATVITIVVKNRGATAISDLAVGYYLDFDLGSSGVNNTVRLAPEAVPAGMTGASAQAYERSDANVSVVHVMHTSTPGVTAQSAGMSISSIVDDGDGFTDADVIKLLSSGTSIQTVTTGDMCSISGIRFPGLLQPNESRTVILVIGVGNTSEEAANVVRATLENPMAVSEEIMRDEIVVKPNPADYSLQLENTVNVERVMMVNANGQVVVEITNNNAAGIMLNTSQLANGMYTMIISGHGQTTTKPVAVIH
ncbi:MAG: S8 family serine peptidase [Ignavibacteria bacterium]|nr:S8 family serine peptidase [Ignavibacteria bacterium]